MLRAHVAAVVLVAVITPAAVQAQTATPQCPPGTTIYIDPRLAPHRPQINEQAYYSLMANPAVSPETKQYFTDLRLNQNQPIQLPFRDGIVLISPKDPCIQQYLGK